MTDDGEVQSFDALLKKELPKIEYHVENIIPKKGTIYVFGPPGTFKTSFLLWLTLKGADGQDVFEFKVEKPFRTLWIDEEMGESGCQDKINKLKNGITFSNPDCLKENFIVSFKRFNLFNQEHIKWLKEKLSTLKPNVVVFDSLARIFNLKESEAEMAKFVFNILSPLVVEFNVVFIIIAHARKKAFQQKSINIEDLAGSREFAASSEGLLAIDCAGGRDEYRLKQVKNRYQKKEYCIDFSVNECEDRITIGYQGTTTEKIARRKKFEQCAEAMLEWKANGGPDEFHWSDADKAMTEKGFKNNAICDALALLLSKKKLVVKNDKYAWDL